MGTDIHMAVESLERDYDKGRDEWKCVVLREGAYGNRDYLLFQILAGVRAGDDIAPIAQPRGLPEDISALAKAEVESGDHSFSWLTLDEVRAYEWDKSFAFTRTVDALNAARIFAGYPPLAWNGGIFGGNIKHVSEAEMRALVKERPFDPWLLRSERTSDLRDLREPHPLADYWANVAWHRTPREACADFLAWLKAFEATRLRYDAPNRVRLVFGFDS